MRSLFIRLLMTTLLLGVEHVQGQVTVYRSLDALLAENGQIHEDGRLLKTKGVCSRQVTIDDGKGNELVLSMEDCFAFVIKDIFYRWDSDSGVPVCLVQAGKVFSWQNGPAQLMMQLTNTTSATAMCGAQAYFSDRLDGELIPVVGNGTGGIAPGKQERKLQAWFAARPHYKPLLDCLTNDRHYITVRHCAQLFNEGKTGKE